MSRRREEPSALERLLEATWEGRDRRASQRELIVEGSVGAAFVVAAVVLLIASGAGPDLELFEAVYLTALYAIVARIQFPVGAGHVVPSHLVLFPMLVILPPGAVPMLVLAGLLVATVIDWRLGRVPPRRILSAVPDAWHAIGAALVLVIAGSPAIGFDDLPLMGIAFVACCLVDFVASLIRVRLTGQVPDVKLQLAVMLTVWAVDACLAPLGFLAAIATEHGLGAVLFVLPLALLLWLLAEDRSRRIAQAHSRLKLVAHERARLQSAVRRLGDAFAARLDIEGLFEILLHGSMEALDATAGRLQLTGLPAWRLLQAGPEELLRKLEADAHDERAGGRPNHGRHDGTWMLTLPITIATLPEPVVGTLRYGRDDRAFEDDEIALLAELVDKAELAAADILSHQVLREQVVTDALTGLGNRRKLAADLAAWLDDAPGDHPALLLLFDLDGFKAYNDAFGHLAGDALLMRLSAKLTETVVSDGTAYRLGGDEFCAFFELGEQDVDALIARTAAALTETGTQFSVRASFGAVLLPHEAGNLEHALQIADQRMYADKQWHPAGSLHEARDVLMRTMQAKQAELDEHSDGVAQLTVAVARQLGLAGETLQEVARAAELHDVGKVGIPDAILNKPAALDTEEWQFMRQHTVLGARILNAAPGLRTVADLVRASHERWDGAGYPDGLSGDDIPFGARIIAVCDAYAAMTSDRPYQVAFSHETACHELRENAGTQFDPVVVDAFLAAIKPNYLRESREGTRSAVQDAAAHVRSLLSRTD